MSTSLTKLYRVNNDDQSVQLSITIGDGQVGVTSINLGSEQIVSNHKNSILSMDIGTGEDLKGKTLYCTTSVTDVQSTTNQTSVMYELHGGKIPFSQTLSETVAGDGDVVFYTATFYFY
jgi:hypothetical protein